MKKEELRKKGWKEKDIKETEKIIMRRHLHDKSRTTVYFNRVIYWMAILVIIASNFIVSLVLVPFLLVLDKISLDIFVIIIGIGIGLIYNFLLLDLEHIEKKHHILSTIIIPIIALFNISLMVKVGDSINDLLQISNVRENPWVVSIIYVTAFLIPFLYSLIRKKY